MIQSYIIGGLGNQLFQYATAKKLAQLNNTSLYLLLDWYNQDFNKTKATPRIFDLSNFDIKYKLPEGLFYRLYNKLYKPLYYNEVNSFEFDDNLLKLRSKNIKISGYWGSFDYFNDFKAELQAEIQPKYLDDQNNDFLKKIKNLDSVSLHIRRTDYLSIDVYCSLNIDYYERAINLIKKKINNPYFFIFSDDIDSIKQLLPQDLKYDLVNINKGYKSYMDLYLMSQCKHNIIANSTFSAWAAYLNTSPDKITICPKNWFNTSLLIQDNLLSSTDSLINYVPKDWIKI